MKHFFIFVTIFSQTIGEGHFSTQKNFSKNENSLEKKKKKSNMVILFILVKSSNTCLIEF
jgi:hypothetical protein